MILGFIMVFFGGIILSIYAIYDLVVNWETLSRIDIFWNLIWLILRDVIAIGGGIVLIIFGATMGDKIS
jgi:hypothetical protein